MKKETKRKRNPPYIVTLSSQGKEYEGRGNTVYDAILRLPVEYMEVKSKGLFTLKHAGRKSERMYFLKGLRRVLRNRLLLQGLAHNLEVMLQ